MISTVSGYVIKIRQIYKSWKAPKYVWFRGEPDVEEELIPTLYRKKNDGTYHDENKLLQMFRMRAATYSDIAMPERGFIDQWLFLAQHVGLPTRLLDWTENALLALYFAIQKEKPIVWMLDPMKLNELSIKKENNLDSEFEIDPIEEFPLTWIRPEYPRINIGHENIRGAWEGDKKGIHLPAAVHPTYLHPRMSAQRSVFTVHGKDKRSISKQVPSDILVKLIINPRSLPSLYDDLKMLGVEAATAFPELDGLARELSERY